MIQGLNHLSARGIWDGIQICLKMNRIEFNSHFKTVFRSQDDAPVKKSHSRHVPGYGLQVMANHCFYLGP